MTTIRTIVAATDFSPGATAALERAVQVRQRLRDLAVALATRTGLPFQAYSGSK